MDESSQPFVDESAAPVLIGCAGWNLPKAEQAHFPEEGSHLERYATVLPAVEINSSFYRPHRPETYARWSSVVPPGFRFAVKIPKKITHELRLCDFTESLETFLSEATALGAKLGCFLVQLPPSLRFDSVIARQFFEVFRSRTPVAIVCEPRHPTWFTDEGEELLRDFKIARVAADPPPVSGANLPGGWRGISYYRLHGSPKIYYSAYTPEFIAQIAEQIREDLAARRDVWCIFDNTALGEATRNALELLELFEADRVATRER